MCLLEFKEGGGVLEVAKLALGAVGLDHAEGVEALLELAGKAMALVVPWSAIHASYTK